jgi:hypothetical protein
LPPNQAPAGTSSKSPAPASAPTTALTTSSKPPLKSPFTEDIKLPENGVFYRKSFPADALQRRKIPGDRAGTTKTEGVGEEEQSCIGSLKRSVEK